MSEIILTRDKGYADRLRKYVVLIDDRKVGTIANGKVEEYYVDPGEHTIQVKIDWCKTKKLAFVADRDTHLFNVKSNLRGWKIILAAVYAFLPYKWIMLEMEI
jgi:hypothetical protein